MQGQMPPCWKRRVRRRRSSSFLDLVRPREMRQRQKNEFGRSMSKNFVIFSVGLIAWYRTEEPNSEAIGLQDDSRWQGTKKVVANEF